MVQQKEIALKALLKDPNCDYSYNYQSPYFDSDINIENLEVVEIKIIIKRFSND